MTAPLSDNARRALSDVRWTLETRPHDSYLAELLDYRLVQPDGEGAFMLTDLGRIIIQSDKDVREAYLRTSGEAGDLKSDLLLDEIKRRNLDI